ncbi:MAG: amidohydrolase family protein [Chloroflexi bacterium]|nr:amidohydrolase family protein [Chloroflexota bacterium]
MSPTIPQRRVFDADAHLVEAPFLVDSWKSAAGPPAPMAPGHYEHSRDRLARMDAQGIQCALLFPTLFQHIGLVGDVTASTTLARAYNDWAHDYASADATRLLPIGILPLQGIDASNVEVRRVAALGFRAVLVPPQLIDGRYVTSAHFDPLWKAIADAGLLASVHPPLAAVGNEMTSYAKVAATAGAWSGVGDALAAIAPAMDCNAFLMTFMSRGVLEKFPTLRIAFFHAGAAWLPLALEKTETAMWLCNQRDPVSLEPGQVFESRRNFVTFGAGDGSVRRMPDTFARLAAWGSHHPYPGTGSAADAIADLKRGGVPKATIAALMGGNAARVLQGVTAR